MEEQRLNSFHIVASSPFVLGSEELLPHVTEVQSCGFRLLTFVRDYSRNFLFSELISLSGGKDYYRYGHILWLLSLEDNKSIELSEAVECESDYCAKNL